MLVSVANAIASIVEETHLKEDYIIPKVNNPRILPIVTQTLKDAIKSGARQDSGIKQLVTLVIHMKFVDNVTST